MMTAIRSTLHYVFFHVLPCPVVKHLPTSSLLSTTLIITQYLFSHADVSGCYDQTLGGVCANISPRHILRNGRTSGHWACFINIMQIKNTR